MSTAVLACSCRGQADWPKRTRAHETKLCCGIFSGNVLSPILQIIKSNELHSAGLATRGLRGPFCPQDIVVREGLDSRCCHLPGNHTTNRADTRVECTHFPMFIRTNFCSVICGLVYTTPLKNFGQILNPPWAGSPT